MRTVALATLFCMIALGCSTDRAILESDVFLPEDMVTIRSANIRRAGGELVGGDFFVGGRVNNAEASMDEVVDYYRSNGHPAQGRSTRHDRTRSPSARSCKLDRNNCGREPARHTRYFDRSADEVTSVLRSLSPFESSHDEVL